MPIILTDENFDSELKAAKKPVLVDFFAVWCGPCSIIAPMLENIEKEFNGEFILAKVNVEEAPMVSSKFGVEVIPTVVLFKGGEKVEGFTGLKPAETIKDWLKDLIKNDEPAEDQTKIIEELSAKFSKHAQENGFKLNPDTKTVERIIKGLLANESRHGQQYCPCRRVTGNAENDKKIVCPCDYHKGELEKDGKCLCGLFVK